MERTIQLQDSFNVDARRGDVIVPVDLTKLSDDILAKLALHGLKQKIADAAASAANNCAIAVAGNKKEGEAKAAYLKRVAEAAEKVTGADVNAEAKRLMEKVRDTLERGEWGVERSGAGGVDKALIDFVIGFAGDIGERTVNMTAIFDAQLEGFKDAKVPEKRGMVDEWLDAKEGRRAEWDQRFADARRAANKAAAEASLDDL